MFIWWLLLFGTHISGDMVMYVRCQTTLTVSEWLAIAQTLRDHHFVIAIPGNRFAYVRLCVEKMRFEPLPRI